MFLQLPFRFTLHNAEYECIRRINRGGQAQIYLGLQRHPDGGERNVAVKLLWDNPDLGPEALQRNRMKREGAFGYRLDHPTLLKVYDHGAVTINDIVGTHAIVMELFQDFPPFLVPLSDDEEEPHAAPNLHDWRMHRHGHRLEPAQVANIALDISVVLCFVHEQGCVVRDIDPCNILCRCRPHRADEIETRLIDLGVATSLEVLDDGIPGATAGKAPKTEASKQPGKAPYLAPEVFGGGTPHASWDWYSLGVVLWECLFGELHFGAKGNSGGQDHPESGDLYEQRFQVALPRELATLVNVLLLVDPEARLDAARGAVDLAKAAIHTLKGGKEPDQAKAVRDEDAAEGSSARLSGEELRAEPDPFATKEMDLGNGEDVADTQRVQEQLSKTQGAKSRRRRVLRAAFVGLFVVLLAALGVMFHTEIVETFTSLMGTEEGRGADGDQARSAASQPLSVPDAEEHAGTAAASTSAKQPDGKRHPRTDRSPAAAPAVVLPERPATSVPSVSSVRDGGPSTAAKTARKGPSASRLESRRSKRVPSHRAVSPRATAPLPAGPRHEAVRASASEPLEHLGTEAPTRTELTPEEALLRDQERLFRAMITGEDPEQVVPARSEGRRGVGASHPDERVPGSSPVRGAGTVDGQ